MPISLSQLTANRKACTVTFEGVDDVLHIEFYPQRLTVKMISDIAAADPETLAAMPAERRAQIIAMPAALLTSVLASWDLTAEDGGPILPIDAATLDGLGINILWSILAAIVTDGNSQGKAAAPTA